VITIPIAAFWEGTPRASSMKPLVSEEGGCMFLRNVDKLVSDCKASLVALEESFD
jgi:hypothetical protein